VTLVENGMADLTFEYIALRHPDQFSQDVILAAKKRLASAGPAL
jgi:hypothetical protein